MEGTGVHIVTSAQTALELGLPLLSDPDLIPEATAHWDSLVTFCL